MTERIELLDHGYCKLIESWGSDERIVEAARMSTNKGFLGWSCWKCDTCGLELDNKQPHTSSPAEFCSNETLFTRIPRDEKLLAYLWDNKHSSPFEMAGIVVEVQAPISVFRQWHRHRSQSYNEMSARYTPLPDMNYVPTVERLMMNSRVNKQAGTIKDADELTVEGAEQYRRELIEQYEADERFYQKALKMGVPKELAREHLPVGRYSRMRASANLRMWLAFLTLRMDGHAQYEIRVYADAVAHFVKMLFPYTYELFAKGLSYP